MVKVEAPQAAKMAKVHQELTERAKETVNEEAPTKVQMAKEASSEQIENQSGHASHSK